MRRLSGVVLAAALVLFPALSSTAQAQDKVTFNGDIAIWSFDINSSQAAQYEQVLAALKDALAKSERPEARRMAAGWKVMRGATNPATGNPIYTHIIYPVVPNADYTIMQIIYEVVKDPMEQKRIYDMYRGAFNQNLGANVGRIVTDFSK